MSGLFSTTPGGGLKSFVGIVGYSAIGMITGLSYPVSFPLLAGHVLLSGGGVGDDKEKKRACACK